MTRTFLAAFVLALAFFNHATCIAQELPTERAYRERMEWWRKQTPYLQERQMERTREQQFQKQQQKATTQREQLQQGTNAIARGEPCPQNTQFTLQCEQQFRQFWSVTSEELNNRRERVKRDQSQGKQPPYVEAGIPTFWCDTVDMYFPLAPNCPVKWRLINPEAVSAEIKTKVGENMNPDWVMEAVTKVQWKAIDRRIYECVDGKIRKEIRIAQTNKIEGWPYFASPKDPRISVPLKVCEQAVADAIERQQQQRKQAQALEQILPKRAPPRDLAENFCSAHMNMIEVVLGMRRNGMPISVAEKVVNSTYDIDPRLYSFMRATVRAAYSDPLQLRSQVSSGEWLRKCGQHVRVYGAAKNHQWRRLAHKPRDGLIPIASNRIPDRAPNGP